MNCALRYAYTILFRTIFGYIARFYRKIKMQNNEVEAFSASLFNASLMQFRPQLCINNHRKVGFLFFYINRSSGQLPTLYAGVDGLRLVCNL